MPANLKVPWPAPSASAWEVRTLTRVSPSQLPLLGEEFETPKLHHAKRALRLVVAVSLLGAVTAIIVRRPRNK